MNNKAEICNNLGLATNTNVTAYCFKTLEQTFYSSFFVEKKYSLDMEDVESIKEQLLREKSYTVLYQMGESFTFNYLGIRGEQKDFFMILGPILLKDPFHEKQQDLAALKRQNLDDYEFYTLLKRIKVIPIDVLSNIIFTLLSSEFKKIEFKPQIKRKISAPVFETFQETYTKVDWDLTEKRYEVENLMLKYIKLGNVERGLHYQKILGSLFNFASRIPCNHFRASKNKLFILSGMMRKSIEDCGIPYVYIHDVSSKIFHWIENASTISELEKVGEDILIAYTELCSKHSQKFEGFSKNIKNALLYIDINLKKSITLFEIAEFLDISQEHLSRSFKKETGENIKDYIQKRKIEKAKVYLKEGKYKIKDIASMLDYSSVEVFSKVFKKYENRCPSEYINLN